MRKLILSLALLPVLHISLPSSAMDSIKPYHRDDSEAAQRLQRLREGMDAVQYSDRGMTPAKVAQRQKSLFLKYLSDSDLDSRTLEEVSYLFIKDLSKNPRFWIDNIDNIDMLVDRATQNVAKVDLFLAHDLVKDLDPSAIKYFDFCFRNCDEDPHLRVERITPLLTTFLNPEYKHFNRDYKTHSGYVINELIEIPTRQFDDVATAIKTLLRPNMSVYTVWQILMYVRKLPGDRMLDIVKAAAPSVKECMDSLDISRILNSFVTE